MNNSNETNEAVNQEQFKTLLSDEQKKFIREELRTLIKDTEDKEDARQYLGDIASDFMAKWPEMEDHWESFRTYLINELRVYHN